MSIYKNIYRICSSCILNFCTKPVMIIKFCKNWKMYCCHKSYFPEYKQKTPGRIFREQLVEIIKYGYPNEFYFPYGHDVKKTNERRKYYHYRPFMVRRNALNIHGIHSSTFILRDKLYFEIAAKAFGISTGENISVIDNKRFFDMRKKIETNAETFFKDLTGIFFIKLINGECGCGIFRINVTDGEIKFKERRINLIDLMEKLGSGRYLVQKAITQHPQMASLHPQSLNTIRLVTIHNQRTNEIDIFPSILRIGTGDSVVDNTSQGGIAVGIDFESGRLKQYGFYKPAFGTRVEIHPDSGIRFSEFEIPYLEEAQRQAKLFHSMLPDVHSIGWDIAISPDGPVFVEGNDNWEIKGPQICNGPLKDLFLSKI